MHESVIDVVNIFNFLKLALNEIFSSAIFCNPMSTLKKSNASISRSFYLLSSISEREF